MQKKIRVQLLQGIVRLILMNNGVHESMLRGTRTRCKEQNTRAKHMLKHIYLFIKFKGQFYSNWHTIGRIQEDSQLRPCDDYNKVMVLEGWLETMPFLELSYVQ